MNLNELKTKATGHRSKNDIRRLRKRHAMEALIIIGVIVILALGIFLIFHFQKENTKGLLQFQGKWVYDEYTAYEFDGAGNGCMCLEDIHYKYTYTVDNNELKIDFKDDSLHDCTYTFTLNDNKLMLVGGEGTVGGTYELHKNDKS